MQGVKAEAVLLAASGVCREKQLHRVHRNESSGAVCMACDNMHCVLDQDTHSSQTLVKFM
jgi:hypothetical protein